LELTPATVKASGRHTKRFCPSGARSPMASIRFKVWRTSFKCAPFWMSSWIRPSRRALSSAVNSLAVTKTTGVWH